MLELPTFRQLELTHFIRYSRFKDTHGNDKDDMSKVAVSHHLEDELKAREITDVFCVGTAGDYCVSHTAIDAAQAGFKAYVIEDITKSFDSGAAWSTVKADMKSAGVRVVKTDSPEVQLLEGIGRGKHRDNRADHGFQWGVPWPSVIWVLAPADSETGERESLATPMLKLSLWIGV